jgi:hypothetical protein
MGASRHRASPSRPGKIACKTGGKPGVRRIGYDFGGFFNLARFGSSAGHDTM